LQVSGDNIYKLYSESAEKAVIGSCLVNKEIIPDTLSMLEPVDFYAPQHFNIFKGIKTLYDKKTVPDIITITEYLKDKGILDSVGGASYISNMASCSVNSGNVEYYARIVREKAVLRELELTLVNITNQITGCEDAEVLLNEAEKKIMALNLYRKDTDVEDVTTIAKRTMKIIEERAKRKTKLIGLSTGLSDLDNMTLGFQNKQLIIIGGRPSKGKSALGLNIATYLALYKQVPVAFFSIEDSKERIVNRIFASQSRVDNRRVRLGSMDSDEWSAVADAVTELTNAPLYIADASYLNRHELNRTARRLKRNKGIQILFIDYLQLLIGDVSANREREISSISLSLKALSKELSIPVVAMAQLNRNPLYRGSKPRLSDLRESGAIENDADVVMLLHRPNIEKAEQEECEITSLIIAKQKDGPIGEINMLFHKKYLRFDNYSEEDELVAGFNT